MRRSLERLSRRTLAQIPQLSSGSVELPPQCILDAPERILQIGFGKFVRAFTGDFVQSAAAAGHLQGRIVAVQRHRDERMRRFSDQDGLYTLFTHGFAAGKHASAKQVIASFSRVLDAETSWSRIIAAGLQPQVRILTTNVSEGGLVMDDRDTPETHPPAGFAGKITQLLYRRWLTLRGPESEIGIVPCELVENNGEVVRVLIIQQAHRWRLDQAFVDWATHGLHVANTVVDRIVVGAPSEDELAAEWALLGYQDDLLDCAEPFYEFILSADDFIRRHFPVDRSCPNVHFVPDLTPYRTRKVLILNGPHTTLAALGWLLGKRTVLEAINDEQLGRVIETMMFKDIIPALVLPSEMELPAYATEVLNRFRNPSVKHYLEAICLNCSVKAGTRMFPSIRRNLEMFGRMPASLALGVAGVYLALRDAKLQDTHADYIRERWRVVNSQSIADLQVFCRELLSKQVEWSREPIDLDLVTPRVAELLLEMQTHGVRAVIARYLDQHAVQPSYN